MNGTKHPLCEVLRSRNPALATRAAQLIERAEPLLQRSVATFPSGTDHSPSHTQALELIACALLPARFTDELTDYELFLLALACHYHDLGMSGNEADNETPQARNLVRAQHALRIRETLLRDWQSFGFESDAEANALAEICVGHRPQRDTTGHASWPAFAEQVAAGQGILIRLRLLCALIYAIDELHLGHDRAPKRVEMLAGIGNATARKHWHRHQRTRGPAVNGDKVQFDLWVTTLDDEQDLRANHLHKALTAFADLREVAGKAGINAPLRSLILQWDRSRLWSLLIVEQLADMRPRMRAEVIQATLDAYDERRRKMVDLSRLSESRNDLREQLFPEVTRRIDELAGLGQLDVSGDEMQLSTAPTAHQAIYELLKGADADDALIGGGTKSCHLLRVLGDEYGRRYVAEHVTPAIEDAYTIYLTADCGVPRLLDAIKSFPTAAAIASHYSPIVTATEKRECLAAIAAGGALLDAIRDPTLLLNTDARRSLREVVRFLAEVLPTYITYLEELAVVQGFTLEQSKSLLLPNDDGTEALADETDDDPHSIRLRITQSIPRNQSAEAVGFWYHLLAQRRAGASLRLIPSASSGLSVEITGGAGLPESAKSTFAMIGIGPGQPLPPELVDMAASVRLLADESTVCFDLRQLQSDGADDCPFLVSLPVRRLVAQGGGTISSRFRIREHRLKMKDLAVMRQIDDLLQETPLVLRFVAAANGQSMGEGELNSGAASFLAGASDPEVRERFAGLPDDAIIPADLGLDTVKEILSRPPGERLDAFNHLTAEAGGPPEIVTNVVLRRATEGGVAYREKFVCMAVGDIFSRVSATVSDDSDITEEQLNNEWQNPNPECRLQSWIAATCSEMEQLLLDWAADPTEQPFPIRFDNGVAPPAEIKSTFSLVRRPKINRGWYFELPILFEIRPPTRRESLVVEHSYWMHAGDERRAEIIAERINEIDAAQKHGG